MAVNPMRRLTTRVAPFGDVTPVIHRRFTIGRFFESSRGRAAPAYEAHNGERETRQDGCKAAVARPAPITRAENTVKNRN
jgi:hypothetical protein